MHLNIFFELEFTYKTRLVEAPSYISHLIPMIYSLQCLETTVLLSCPFLLQLWRDPECFIAIRHSGRNHWYEMTAYLQLGNDHKSLKKGMQKAYDIKHAMLNAKSNARGKRDENNVDC